MRRRTPLITVGLALAFAAGSTLMVAGCEEEWEEGLDQVPEPREQQVPEHEDPHIQDDPMFQDEPAPLTPEREAEEDHEHYDEESEAEDENADQDSDADESEQAY